MKAAGGRFGRGVQSTLLAVALLTVGLYGACPHAYRAVSACAETASPALTGDTAAETQAALEELFVKYDTLGACVCVFENGAITDTFCYGTLSPDGAPVTEGTLFRVGSISKMVAAMGVMRLADEGQATLDGDLSALIGVTVRNPRYPDTPVTLRQLMSHTAGFRDSGLYSAALRGNAPPLTELFSARFERYFFFEGTRPGAKMEYSNFGGGLLGVVIETLTGQTVDDYMTENVFAPLGVTAAYDAARLPAEATVADMFNMPGGTLNTAVREDAAVAAEPDPLTDYTLTAGKLTISAPDLAKLLIALCDGGVCGDARVLSETACAEMRTAQNGIGSVSCDSGWGLDMNIVTDALVDGRTLYGHGGKANGMLCAAYFDPDDRTGVVMLTNGCNNLSTTNGMGTLGVMVLRQCYTGLIDGRHETLDPWLVAD